MNNNNNTTYTYWKSTYTGQVYRMTDDSILNSILVNGWNGWEPVHEETYIEYAKEHGLL